MPICLLDFVIISAKFDDFSAAGFPLSRHCSEVQIAAYTDLLKWPPACPAMPTATHVSLYQRRDRHYPISRRHESRRTFDFVK